MKTNIYQDKNGKEESNIWEKLSNKEGGEEGGCCNQQVWEPIIFSDERREHRNQGL